MFKIDDKVILASGGPVLTVIGFSRNGRIWCEWHDADGELDEASFVPEALRRLDDN